MREEEEEGGMGLFFVWPVFWAVKYLLVNGEAGMCVCLSACVARGKRPTDLDEFSGRTSTAEEEEEAEACVCVWV